MLMFLVGVIWGITGAMSGVPFDQFWLGVAIMIAGLLASEK